ncbi:hypothetical protein [Cupriavidus sp. TMH.W2]|uniref:hypothetical protein n=1 Tax=Cupriavidus sp. TMH.W2 TaxID=3434465 RepID=UPI003D784271
MKRTDTRIVKLTQAGIDMLLASVRERVGYHVLSTVVRGKRRLGVPCERESRELARLAESIATAATSVRIHGYIAVEMRGQHISATTFSRKATAVVRIPSCSLDVARELLTSERVEALWCQKFAEDLDEDESIGSIDWAEILDDLGRIISTGRLRFGSLSWEPAGRFTQDQIATHISSAEGLEMEAAEAFRLDYQDLARRKFADAAYLRSLAEAGRFCRQAMAFLEEAAEPASGIDRGASEQPCGQL